MNNNTATTAAFKPTVGTYVAQTINGRTNEPNLVTKVAGDVVWLRPAMFAGYPNHRRSFPLHRMFWNTLAVVEG